MKNILFYTNPALTNNIPEMFESFMNKMENFCYIFAFLCFLLLIVWRVLETISANPGENKPLPILKITAHLALVLILIKSNRMLIPGIIAATNYIADKIFGPEEILNLIQTIWSNSYQDALKFTLFFLDMGKLVGLTAGLCAKIAFYILGYLRYFLLCILYVFSPLAFSLSLIPMFGFDYLIKYFINILQISSWVIFAAILNLFIIRFCCTGFDVDSIEFIIIMVLYFCCTIFIPKIAAQLIGGVIFPPFLPFLQQLPHICYINKNKEIQFQMQLGGKPHTAIRVLA